MPGLTLKTVLQRLRRLYDPPKTFLDFGTPLELLIATILSAQCTDARVNIVTKTLFAKYRSAADYVRAPRADIEAEVRSCGHYRSKAKYIQETCRIILEEHGGQVPRTMEELTRLPGVGRKTASVVLSAAFGINEGIAVDTHVLRLSQRLGLSRHPDPKRVELDLMPAAPRAQWRDVTTLLISHGRAVCTARARKCHVCVFKEECPSSLVMGRHDKAKSKAPGRIAEGGIVR